MTIFLLLIGISVLIFIHELGHFLCAKAFGLYVEEFGFGFPPRLFGKKIGETVYSFNLLPFGGFVKIFGERADLNDEEGKQPQIPPERNFSRQSIWKRFVIIAAGVVMNFFLGWVLLSFLFFTGLSGPVIVSDVAVGSPAEAAGFKTGDGLVDFRSSTAFVDFVAQHRGEAVTFSILRATTTLSVVATPDLNPAVGRGALGVAVSESGFPELGFFGAIKAGLFTAAQTIWLIISSLGVLIAGLFVGRAPAQAFVGPIGIFQIAAQSARFGLLHLVQLVALISLNLAVLNAVPFPALDGGRMLFLLIEKIKGSALSAKREMIANAIGFWLLILLMIFVTARDVIKLF